MRAGWNVRSFWGITIFCMIGLFAGTSDLWGGSLPVTSPLTIPLTVPNGTATGLGTPPFATITYTMNGGKIDVKITANEGFCLFGDFALGFLNAGGLTVSNIDSTYIGGGKAPKENPWSVTSGDDGLSEFEIEGLMGSTGKNGWSFRMISFTLAPKTGSFGTDWSQILAANEDGYYAAAHVAPLSSTGARGTPTGFAAGGFEKNNVTEPDSLVLLLSGLSVLSLGCLPKSA